MRKALITILVIVIVGFGFGLLGYYFYYNQKNEDDFTTVKAETMRLEELLEIEAVVFSKKIEELGFLEGDEVKEIKYQVGDEVNQDDVLIIFENEVEMKAPFDGTIIDLPGFEGMKKPSQNQQTELAALQVPGQTAQSLGSTDQTLLTIANMEDLEFKVKIDEDQIQQVDKDQEVRLKCDVNDEITIYGVVEKVSLLAKQDSDGSTYYQVSGNVLDLNDLVPRYGMNCDGEIILEVKEDVLTVPDNSVIFEDSKTYVYLYNPTDLSVTKKNIETGIEGRNVFEVVDGLSEGDEVLENTEGYSVN